MTITFTAFHLLYKCYRNSSEISCGRGSKFFSVTPPHLTSSVLALFALFEKRRNEVARVVEELKRWE